MHAFPGDNLAMEGNQKLGAASERDGKRQPFSPGAVVIATLCNPREKFWGMILALAPEGLSLSGAELASFEDLAVMVRDGEPFTPAVVFFPMHRIERVNSIYPTETCLPFPSASSTRRAGSSPTCSSRNLCRRWRADHPGHVFKDRREALANLYCSQSAHSFADDLRPVHRDSSGGRPLHWALVVFVIAGFSDGLDGLLARRLHQQTLLGQYLDPIADKLLLSTMFLVLSILHKIPWKYTVMVFSRDISILAASAVLFAIAGLRNFRPSIFGKANTLCQISAVFFVLLLQIYPVAGSGLPARFLRATFCSPSSPPCITSFWSRRECANIHALPPARTPVHDPI